MRKIYKYQLDSSDVNELSMPVGAEVLCVQVQYGEPHIWALINDVAPIGIRRFAVIGTGHDFPDGDSPGCNYVGSFQLFDGELVFHVFEYEC